MKIQPAQFQRLFLERAEQKLKDLENSPELPAANDSIELGNSTSGPALNRVDQAVVALTTAAGATGVAVLAALAQEVGRQLVDPEQETRFSESRLSAFADRQVADDPRLNRAWHKLEELSVSSFQAPRVINSPIVVAEAGTREIFIGAEALDGELSDPAVLLFTLAHEEAHRRNRDSAGSWGLEALLAADASKPSFQALREGRHQNEYAADAFGAEIAARAGCAPEPILAFLAGCHEDIQHPDGPLRARAAREVMAAHGQSVSNQVFERILEETA